MSRKRKGIALLLCLVLLLALIPTAHGASRTVTVYVNGKKVNYKGGLAPYEDWSAGGRVMVPIRQTAAAIPCTKVTWNEELQQSRVSMSLNCNYSYEVFLNLYPGSYTAEVYDSVDPWPLDANMTYRLDAKTVLINDAVHASARMLADAFKCYSWWDENDYSFNIDCTRPSKIHQNLETVMAAYPPQLTSDGRFVVPTVGGAYPMYPRTVEAYATYVTQASNIGKAMGKNLDANMTMAHETYNNRIRVFDARDPSNVYGYQYGNFMQLKLDAERQIDFKARLKRAKGVTVGFAFGLGTLLGAVASGISEDKAFKAAITVMGSIGSLYVTYVKDSDLENYDACVSKAKYNMRRQHRMDDEAVVTVAIHWPTSIHCIPDDIGSEVLTWEQFAATGY